MSVRRTALQAIIDILDKGAYANLCLKEAEEKLPRDDARWVSAAVYMTLDHLYYIDYVIAAFAKGHVKPSIRGVLRLGVCQALYMNTPHRAACDESVKLTKEIGKAPLAAFVNGVMRNVCRAIEDGTLPKLPDDIYSQLSIQYSYPEFLVREYVEAYGAEFARDMMATGYSGMTVRPQPPYTADELEAWLQRKGVGFSRGTLVDDALRLDSGFDVARETLFSDGMITVQSESAMLACKLLGLRDGMRVLDACAAPGGKTAYISTLLHGTGSILAWELHPHRTALMENTLSRLRVKNATCETRDASVFDKSLEKGFDAVLVDAPCSGFGVFGKADARYNKDDGTVNTLSETQREILSACANYVAEGGTLVYATCTVSRRENEDVAAAFLRENTDFRAADICEYLPSEKRERVKNGMIQLFGHLDGTESFFMAKFIRKSE